MTMLVKAKRILILKVDLTKLVKISEGIKEKID